eukprot:GEMP01107214.1.p1 GENE.GEMP01107214.1~~GEMP01107214.1.p1  ORF type:complete len:129 (+),score=14.04 GEMP01107214.1:167-553(+)
MPEYARSFPSTALYPGKIAEVKRSIRAALFRQSLYKVQNVEVTTMEQCPQLRILTRVFHRENPRRSLHDWWLNADIMREEIWSVDRCGENHDYRVRYYREDGDGFSSIVAPVSIVDRLRQAYFFCCDE